jgi:hypothetical protein
MQEEKKMRLQAGRHCGQKRAPVCQDMNVKESATFVESKEKSALRQHNISIFHRQARGRERAKKNKKGCPARQPFALLMG